MTYEGINFTEDWVRSKSLDEFLAECEVNKDVWWPNDPNRIQKAKSFYALIMPVVKAKAGGKTPAKAFINKELDNDVHGTESNDQQV
jgi:hypothetical protein